MHVGRLIVARSMFVLAMATGCATIPRQSVELNAALTSQISDMQRAHVALFNRYFDELEQRLRQSILGDYKDALVQKMKTKQKEKGKELTLEQYDKIIARVLAKQDQVLADLQKKRSEALSEILGRYSLMQTESQALQGLLKSASDLQDIARKLAGAAGVQAPSAQVFESLDAKVKSYSDEIGHVKDSVEGFRIDENEATNVQPR